MFKGTVTFVLAAIGVLVFLGLIYEAIRKLRSKKIQPQGENKKREKLFRGQFCKRRVCSDLWILRKKIEKANNFLRITLDHLAEGVGAVIKISWGPRFDSRPGRGLNIWVTFFPAKVHSAFHPSGVGKMSTSIHGPIWSGCQRRLYILPVRWR